MSAEKIHTEFAKRFGTGGTLFQAPGRINLIGEHTDYNQGWVLPASINRYISAEIKPNNTQTIRAYSIDFDEEVQLNLHDLPKKNHWSNYILGVAAEMQRAGYFISGFDCVISGDIPQGAGLSSSAALEAVIAVGLNDLLQLHIPREKLAQICQSAEHNYAGVPCGIMDQFASLLGKENQAIQLDCRTLTYTYFPIPEGARWLLLHSGVKHKLADSEYGKRRKECEQGVDVLNAQFPEIKSLRDASLQQLNTVKEKITDTVFNRCKYVIEENERVALFCQALQENDFETAGKLLNQTHAGLSKLYEVSCEELDLLVSIAMETQQVYGARLMGGGFGGCTLNLLKEDFTEKQLHEIQHQFENTFGYKPVVIEVKTGKGASVKD